MTAAGMIIGTAAYMSPEQAKGRVVDRRADIWSFGCVLFEMLSGKRAFNGDDVSDVFVSVLRDEPAWEALPLVTPPGIRKLLHRCLQKDPKKRLPHIGVAKFDLAEGETGALVAPPARVSGARRLIGPIGWTLAGGVAVAAAMFALRPRVAAVAPQSVVRFEITAPPGGDLPGGNGVPRFAVSPDGQTIAYQVTLPDRTYQLFLRSIDGLEPRALLPSPLRDNLAIQQPFWSPDGRYLGFFDEIERKLKAADIQSGTVRIICDVAGNQFTGAWNSDGQILFGTTGTAGLQSVSAGGGGVT